MPAFSLSGRPRLSFAIANPLAKITANPTEIRSSIPVGLVCHNTKSLIEFASRVRKGDCELMFTLSQQAAGVRKQVTRLRSQSQVCDEVLREKSGGEVQILDRHRCFRASSDRSWPAPMSIRPLRRPESFRRTFEFDVIAPVGVCSERTRRSISPRAVFASPRFQELANFLIVTGIARTADLQPLTVFELKLPAAGVRGGADTATFAEQLRDFGGVLLHVAAADKARQHGNITSAVANDETQMGFGHSAALGGANSPFCAMVGMRGYAPVQWKPHVTLAIDSLLESNSVRLNSPHLEDGFFI